MEDGGVVIGLGFRPAATPAEVSSALTSALADARCGWSEVVAIATLESRRGHPALGDATVPVRFFSAAALAGVRTPNPAAGVARAVGTASVAEAAALVSSGARALLVPKRCTPRVCTAVARIGGAPA
jgi:cobalamin biosynthesis protein CbiG